MNPNAHPGNHSLACGACHQALITELLGEGTRVLKCHNKECENYSMLFREPVITLEPFEETLLNNPVDSNPRG